METLMENLNSEPKYKVQMGDFNTDFLKSSDCPDFLNLVISSFLYPLITILT